MSIRTTIPPILLALFLLATLPWWLPINLGGDMAYATILTGSMKGSLDPGSFVILRRSDAYGTGDVVGYQQETGEGRSITIVHRVIALKEDGGYVFKGDANPNHEEVEREALIGRMVIAIPWLGLIPGTLKAFPFAAIMLLPVLWRKSARGVPVKRHRSMFPVVLLLVLAGIPFYETGLVTIVGRPLAVALPLVLLGFTRAFETRWARPNERYLVDFSYILAIALAGSMAPTAEIIESMRRMV